MNKNIFVYLAVVGLFVLGGLLVFGHFKMAAGALLTLVGVAAIVFSRSMAAAQKEIAESRYGLKRWGNVTPLTFGLWGVGIAIVGLAWVLIW